MNRLILPLLLSFALLTACGSDSATEPAPEAELVRFEVEPYRQACVGEGQFLCLIVRAEDEESASLFYGGIIGFDHQWGHQYTLQVRRESIPEEELVADGSSVRHELVEIESETEDPEGTRYELTGIFLLDHTFERVDGQYEMIGKPFQCQDTEVCDDLVAINDTGGMVNVTMEYRGNGEIRLIDWE
ncbi:DUF4377 domain-containing protein [Marinimicrobium agarilyticum]|uniref:DUF4377 domain-containing protein n=1 Tax=Marinimicrobium agarilyticum TaxID=306546 RepID=UPI000402A516|nr:DUF4377 domain-containing protein [Marinimicrobium agarilyticum]